MGSKRKYVHKRITHLSGDELLALARKLLAEYDMPRLDDFLGEMTVHAERRITDLTRKAVLAALDDQGHLFGDVDVFEGLDTLAPQWEEVITDRPAYAFPTLRRDIQRHYIDNEDYSNREVLERCGGLYRSCLGLLSLSRRYGKERLEAACERALALGTVRYRHVRDLLANNRDLIAQEAPAEWTSPAHANVRGPDYYQ